MDLYEKIYKILTKSYIPLNERENLLKIEHELTNLKEKISKDTSCYYNDELKKLNNKKLNIIEDISCYHFYKLNNVENIYDLHGLRSNELITFLDAIFDYQIEKQNFNFKIITGNGKILKPKTIKYLKDYNVDFKIYGGQINIINFY